MSLQTEIQARKEILKTRLANINESLVSKGVDPVQNLAAVPAAIDAIEVGGGGSDDMEWFNDGNTHIWISLTEDTKHYTLEIKLNGVISVDWGDGSEPTIVSYYQPQSSGKYWSRYVEHEYETVGDYVITIQRQDDSLDYEYYLYKVLPPSRNTSDWSTQSYRNTVHKLEFANCIKDNMDLQKFTSVTEVVLSSAVTKINSYMFNMCVSLKCITIPNGITNIEHYAFKNSGIEDIEIPSSVTAIGYSAFAESKQLKSINIPDGVTSIEKSMFESCLCLENIVLPDGLTTIMDRAFMSCASLRNIHIPNSVTSIGENALCYCESIKNLILPNNISHIPRSMAYGCYGLEYVTIPPSVTSIDSQAFMYCRSLKCVDISKHTTIPSLVSTNAFTDISSNCEIRVPMALVDEWKAATNWSTYADRIVGV